MGQKINPISLRLQKTNRKYDSSWYSNYHYGELFLFDLKVRDYLGRILKQIKYPEGRVLISHFSKGSKINLFAFNPTSSRQQKSASFGLKGGAQILKPSLAHHLVRAMQVKEEGKRKLSPVLAKNFPHRSELRRPLKALSSKSKEISIDLAVQMQISRSWFAQHKVLLANQSSSTTCSEKKNSVLGTTTLCCESQKRKSFEFITKKSGQATSVEIKGNTSFKQNTNKTGNKRFPFLPYLELSCSASGTKFVPSDWQDNGSHLVPFFALKSTLNPSYLLKAKRLRDSCFGTGLQQVATPLSLDKQQVVSKTLSLWYQRAQTSTHPLLITLGADKRTIPFLTKETSCKAVAKSNPYLGLQNNVKQVVGDPKEKPLRANFQQKFPSSPCLWDENSLYRCHVEVLLDQQTGSSVKLVPFQVSTEKQSALFLAQEVVYFLEKRVSFRKIKDQILNSLKNSKTIKGVRITCSGRVGGKSKKAQKAKTETVKQGQTSLGVFSSRIDFAQKSALTSFGLIGVKVWICFY